MKKLDVGDHVTVTSRTYHGLSGIVKNLVDVNNQLFVEFKADITGEIIDKSYEILTDDCSVTREDDKFNGLEDVVFEEKIFKLK